MRCSKCGVDNLAGNSFCTNCGAKLEAAATVGTPDTTPRPLSPTTASSTAPKVFCRQCGAQMEQEAHYCSRCGYKLTAFCPKCGSRLNPDSQFCTRCGLQLTQAAVSQSTAMYSQVPATSQVTRVPTMPDTVTSKRPFPRASTIAAGIGALLMLISLALPFYTLRSGGYSANVSAGHLLTTKTDWAGTGLPVLLIIIFASILLLSVIIGFLTRRTLKPLWFMLGMLCIFAVIGNAGYILVQIHRSTAEWVNIIAPGCVLAFVGAVIASISGRTRL
jgi:ribosomal protein L40E